MEILYYCKRCGNPVYEHYGSGTYCSRSCANSRKGIKQLIGESTPLYDENGNRICLNCGKIIKKLNKYCTHKCQMEYQQKMYEQQWLEGKIDGVTSDWCTTNSRIRTYLFKKYDNKCSNCGWGEINPFTNTIPLEVEHIDGNPYNNQIRDV